jgi:hypothetical protein
MGDGMMTRAEVQGRAEGLDAVVERASLSGRTEPPGRACLPGVPASVGVCQVKTLLLALAAMLLLGVEPACAQGAPPGSSAQLGAAWTAKKLAECRAHHAQQSASQAGPGAQR